jgi:hypothetical protein
MRNIALANDPSDTTIPSHNMNHTKRPNIPITIRLILLPSAVIEVKLP